MERSFGIEMEFKGLTMQQSLAALKRAGLRPRLKDTTITTMRTEPGK